MGWPQRAILSLEQEVVDFHLEQLDWWDEEFERITGKLPSFSRLIIARALEHHVSVAQANEMFGHGRRWACVPTDSTGPR